MSDGQAIIAAVREIAAERPDFIYQKPHPNGKCQYMHGDEPGCIIGHALFRLGYINAGIVGIPSSWGASLNSVGVDDLVESLDLTVRFHELRWIRAVQSVQDKGAPWGEAVAAADQYYRLEAA